jgi:hypothetical protein
MDSLCIVKGRLHVFDLDENDSGIAAPLPERWHVMAPQQAPRQLEECSIMTRDGATRRVEHPFHRSHWNPEQSPHPDRGDFTAFCGLITRATRQAEILSAGLDN